MARVLLVDDDQHIIDLLQSVLARTDHEVSIARSGREALAVLEGEPIDLVISDVFMPGGTGIELLVAMRSKRIDTGFIGVSGGHLGMFGPFANALRSLGATAALQKPFAPAELLAAVDKVLKDREALQ